MDGRFEEVEETKPELSISRPPMLYKPPYTWLVISDGEENERQTFYNITENHCYVRYIPELKNKYVSWCQKGWLVVRDECISDCFLLNILTMEKLQLPPLHSPHHELHNCVLSRSPSMEMDRSCRIVFLEEQTSRSCYYGDSEFVEQEFIIDGATTGIIQAVNFEGKLYALTIIPYHVLRFDFSDSTLSNSIRVINGESTIQTILLSSGSTIPTCHLVESCGDLLLVCIGRVDSKVSDVTIYRADFSNEKWEKLTGIGDRAIFVESCNSLSTQASAFGLKGNAVYWVNKRGKGLYMYDLEKKTLSTYLPSPNVGPNSYLFWALL